VSDLPEPSGRRRAHFLRRRVRGDEIRKAFLDGVEPQSQRVVFGVCDAWCIVLVIAPVVAFELQREPLVLDLGLSLGEAGNVGKLFGF